MTIKIKIKRSRKREKKMKKMKTIIMKTRLEMTGHPPVWSMAGLDQMGNDKNDRKPKCASGKRQEKEQIAGGGRM